MLLHAERDEIRLNPDYQRMGGIWTKEKKQLLIDSILNDYDIPKLYFHTLPNEEFRKTGYKYSVIDGRQRLETIWDFMDGKFSLADDIDYQRDSSVDLTKLTYNDIAKKYPKIKIKFDSFVLPIVTVEIADNDIDLIEDMFSRLNEAVPLNAAEKRNAIGGDLVKSIIEISKHLYFTKKVKFTSARYKHRDVAVRLLLIEDSLSTRGSLIDTKRVYLDALTEKYKTGHIQEVRNLTNKVTDTLDIMAKEFMDNDELLSAQGLQTVYYLVFRTALIQNNTSKVTRIKLLDFRNKLSENRDVATKNYETADFQFLEFDRLNQQGTNDASSIKERYHILCNFLQIQPMVDI